MKLRAAAVAVFTAATCIAVPGTDAAASQQAFALSVMHFNVQYVAGGLVGFLPNADPRIDKSAEEVEDAIVTQSFEPVLDMFLAHPTWGADIELQGYMLDVMAARHPTVLAKLRTLATADQIEVVSFHYGDQLFLAYPREDWRRSEELTRAAFDRYGIPRSTTVFCQEGQAGPGMAAAMADAGYETLVFPKNLFAYEHGDATDPKPLYRWGDIQMITSKDLSYADGTNTIDVRFWFVDDGELFATGGVDPYLIEKFQTDPQAIAKRVGDLEALEAQGYAITTVSKYAAAIAPVVAAAEPPPLLDGTWQPNSTDGISRWLGGAGVWWQDERDDDVRTLGAMAHRELVAAETIARRADVDADAEISAGFRLLALGQVSDGTGINPFRGEVEYAIAHFTEVLRIARDVIGRSKERLGMRSLVIDAAHETVEEGAAASASAEAAPWFAIDATAGDRSVDVSWLDAGTHHAEVRLHFGAGTASSLSARFPGTTDDIVYTPGLSERPLRVPRGGFAFDHFDLALSDGLIGLGSKRFVIKDQANVHVAARITPDSGDVEFHDDTAPPGEETTWVFHVFDGDDAAALATQINVLPTLVR